MRIVQVITGLGMGGAERVLLDLCSEFAAEGHDVVIFSMTDDIAAVKRGVHSAVGIETLGISRNPVTWVTGGLRFARSFGRYRPDIVHAHMYHAALMLLTAKVLMRDRTPLAFTSHTSVVRGAFREWFLRSTRRLRGADTIFCRGQHEKINCENVAVIPNGIPVSLQVQSSKRKGGNIGRPWRFVNVGRFCEPKNQMGLLAQFAEVVEQGVDSELWLIGDGPMRGEIEAEATRLNITAKVKLLGQRTDVMELLAMCDVFVLSSKWEGLPIALLEAGLVELPVISTSVGSIPELLADGCGVMVPAQGLGQAMCSVVEHYESAIDMGKRLGARVRNEYSMHAMTEAHIRLYSSLIELDGIGVAK